MKNTILRSAACLTFALSLFLPVLTAPASAEEGASCIFVSLENSAWVSSKDSGVKRTLKVGDVLTPGDKIMVVRGNNVQFAFDKEMQNIMQVDGDSSFLLTSINPARISLEKGKIFSVLDRLPSGSRFVIETPTAVAAVRGTQYQVNTNGALSNILVYRGAVEVSGRTESGGTTDAVMLNAGQKTSVAELGQLPKEAASMNDTETNEISSINQKIDTTRQSIKPEQIEKWLKVKTWLTTESGENIPMDNKDQSSKDSTDKDKKGLVVI